MPQCCFQQSKNTCAKQSANACADWKVGRGLCEGHIQHVRARLNNKSAALGGTVGKYVQDIIDKHENPVDSARGRLIEDYIKIFAMMMDRDFCKEQLALLNAEILSASGGQLRPEDERFSKTKRETDQNYARISRVLEYYEGLCWFPTTHRLYTGSLTSDNYQESIALGYMPKDAGAGAEHGEYSHRLQWHIIMRVVTDGFTVPYRKGVWSHSPLKLFCYLGTEEAMNLNYWGFMLDTAAGVRYDNPAVLNRDLSGAFESAVGIDNWRKDNALLAQNVQRRTDKRRRLLKRAKEIYNGLPQRQKSDSFPTSGLDFESNVIGLLEKWKKLGKPLLNNTEQWYHMGKFHKTNNDVLHTVLRKLWKELGLKNVSRSRRAYMQDPTETNAALLKGESLMTKEIIAWRVDQSLKTLNITEYCYATNAGAYRKSDAWPDPHHFENLVDL